MGLSPHVLLHVMMAMYANLNGQDQKLLIQDESTLSEVPRELSYPVNFLSISFHFILLALDYYWTKCISKLQENNETASSKRTSLPRCCCIFRWVNGRNVRGPQTSGSFPWPRRLTGHSLDFLSPHIQRQGRHSYLGIMPVLLSIASE